MDVTGLIFADYFKCFHFTLRDVGRMAQVCREFGHKCEFSVKKQVCRYTITAFGAEFTKVSLTRNILVITNPTVDCSASRGAVFDIALQRYAVSALRLQNGLMMPPHPTTRRILSICGIPYADITVAHWSHRCHRCGVPSAEYMWFIKECDRGGMPRATILLPGGHGSIDIDSGRIIHGKIRLERDGPGQYQYILGSTLFNSFWSPDEIKEYEPSLLSPLLVVVPETAHAAVLGQHRQ